MWPFDKGKELKKLREIVVRQQQALLFNQQTNQFASVQAIYPSHSVNDAANRYCTTDDVYAIIKRLATTSALIPMYPYYEKNAVAAKELKHFQPTGKPWQQKQLATKALEDLPETDPVYELLENPSDLLSKFEFYEAAYSMLYLHGRCLIYKERGEVRNTPRKLHILFPQFVVMNVTGTWPQSIVSYDYVVNGIKVKANIPPEDIIDIKYFNPNFGILGAELEGLSTLRVLSNRLVRMDNEMDVSVAQLQNGGVNTIVYMEDMSNETDKVILDGHKDNFYRFTGNKQNTGSVYWAGGKMQAIPLGLKLSDMEVTALGKIDFKKLCNAYSISDILFNSDTAATESNVKEMRKALYTDACLPNVFRFAAALQNAFKDDFPDRKRIIYADITGIPELQENMADFAAWLNVAWWILPNEKREMMKYDKSDNPIFDNYIIPTGLQLIDDLLLVDDLPNPANDYDNGNNRQTNQTAKPV